MHSGHPCPKTNYDNEYFKDGVTNGAKWYNVQGKPVQNLFLTDILSHVSAMKKKRLEEI